MEQLLQDPVTLIVVCVVLVLVLKLIKASVKVIITGVIIAAIVWALYSLVPELAAAAMPLQQEVFTCLTV